MGAALIAAWFPAGARAACNPAVGATYNVSDPSDSEVGQRPAPGTLRYVIANASPGTVIGFCENYVIRLNSPITIPAAKEGLQLLGPTTIAEAPAHDYAGERTDPNGKFIVEAGNVAFRDLSFINVNIGASDEADGLRILGNRFSVLNPRRDGKGAVIELDGRADRPLRDVQVGSDAQPNTIQSSQQAAIASVQTDRLRIVGNSIDAAAGDFAIDDDGASRLLVRANTILGAFNGDVESGTIAANSFTHTGARAIRVFARIDRFGPVTVAGNDLLGGGGIRLDRDAVEVRGNTVGGARSPGIDARCNSGIGDAVGPTRIEENVVRDSAVGVLYRCPRNSAPAVVKGNLVEANRAAGLNIGGRRIEVEGNDAAANGAQGIVVSAPWGAVRLRANRLTGNAGDGVEFRPSSRASIAGGTISANRGAGALVGGGALVGISRVVFGGNGGPGIDLLPRGVTANAVRKPENRNLGWPVPAFDPREGRISGRACGRCLVEAFAVETGDRAGNPRNGEGGAYRGSVTARPDGRFSYPARGSLTCAQARALTFTATARGRGAAVTSEFSPDVRCAVAPPARPPSETPPPAGCAGDATTTATIRDENFDGLAETPYPTEIPPGCDIGLRGDGRTGRGWSIRVYDAGDSSKLYFCHDGTDPPRGEVPCTSPQPTNPPDSDITASIVRESGAWRLYLHANTRQPDFSLTVRAHYGWSGS